MNITTNRPKPKRAIKGRLGARVLRPYTMALPIASMRIFDRHAESMGLSRSDLFRRILEAFPYDRIHELANPADRTKLGATLPSSPLPTRRRG
jgi:hypothetical protein